MKSLLLQRIEAQPSGDMTEYMECSSIITRDDDNNENNDNQKRMLSSITITITSIFIVVIGIIFCGYFGNHGLHQYILGMEPQDILRKDSYLADYYSNFFSYFARG